MFCCLQCVLLSSVLITLPLHAADAVHAKKALPDDRQRSSFQTSDQTGRSGVTAGMEVKHRAFLDP